MLSATLLETGQHLHWLSALRVTGISLPLTSFVLDSRVAPLPPPIPQTPRHLHPYLLGPMTRDSMTMLCCVVAGLIYSAMLLLHACHADLC